VASWLGSLPDGDVLLDRLITIGLTAARAKKGDGKHSLKMLIERFTRLKTPSLANRSIGKLSQSLGKLVEKFGESKAVESFTVADASAFESWVFETGGSLAYARTLNRYAKQLFDYACDLEWIEVNPCRKLKTTAVAASVRHYVTPEDAIKLIKACPSLPWRVIVGLGRYAGLRVPSELFTLSWTDINLEKKSIRIAAGKTKERVCPIVAELFPILLAAKDAATGDLVVETSYSNVRRKLPKIVEKAGLDMWEDAFQTLRRSFETHMIDLGCPAHAVSSWVGHSVQVSEDH
jgi:integrase